jgi:Tol biopolymer transport system component
VALALLLLVASTAIVLSIASRPRIPAPFGPARNGLIAYEAADGIHLVDPVSGTDQTLSGSEPGDHAPLWSPDGTLISFGRGASSNLSLVVASATGAGLHALPNATLLSTDSHEVAWSPDSTRIAYIARSDGRVHVAGVDGGSDIPITPDGSIVDSVAWRPGASELLVRISMDGGYELARVAIDGTVHGLGPADGDRMDYQYATWSPDGVWVAYQKTATTTGLPQLHVARFDGSDDRVISSPDQDAFYPDWAPDGRQVLYYSSTSDGPYRLFTVSAEIGARPIAISPGFGISQDAWSPDGSTVIVQLDSDPTVYLLSPAGGGFRTAPYRALGYPAWQRLPP